MSISKSINKRVNKRTIDNALKSFPLKLKKASQKGLFIDCGSNLGQGYTYFKDYFTPNLYDAILIEPNPNCMTVVREKFKSINNIEFIEAAAWINEDKLNFFGLVENERGDTSDGGSIIEDHNSTMYKADVDNSITVDSISFSKLIEDKKDLYDQIVVKMDIESAEYKVLEDLIKTDAIKYIDLMFIEFHHQYFKDEQEDYIKLEKTLIKQIKSKGVKVALWH